MKRFILILVALLVVATGFTQPKKVNLDIKALKELVGVATYEKVDSLLGFQTTLESGEKVFQGINEYEKMLLAYRCRFNEKNILQSIEFVSRSCMGYAIDMAVHRIKPYAYGKYTGDSPDLRRYRWDGREIVVDLDAQTVIVYKPKPNAR